VTTKRNKTISPVVRLHLDINLKALAEEFVKRYCEYELRPERGGELESKKLSILLRHLKQLGLTVAMFDDYSKYVLRDRVSGTKIIWMGAGYEIGFTNLKFARLVKMELEKVGSDSGSRSIKIYKEIE
jgi:hypothetical protein